MTNTPAQMTLGKLILYKADDFDFSSFFPTSESFNFFSRFGFTFSSFRSLLQGLNMAGNIVKATVMATDRVIKRANSLSCWSSCTSFS